MNICFAIFSSLFLLVISSCGKEDTFGDYPFLYVYDFHEIQRSEYVVLTQNGSTDIGAQGTFVMSEPYIKEIIDDDPEQFILFKSFELLDEENIKTLFWILSECKFLSDTIMKYSF
ncbi:MAG: hypothetical protein R2784_13090 [Saprospiraceae bacterium]